MEVVAKFLSTLFASRTQAHIFHLQTMSYAVHKALNEYYDDITDHIDNYAETCQGKHGIIKGYNLPTQLFEDDSALKYFMGLQSYIDSVRGQLPQDGELNNIVDEIAGLVATTVYKLRFLK